MTHDECRSKANFRLVDPRSTSKQLSKGKPIVDTPLRQDLVCEKFKRRTATIAGCHPGCEDGHLGLWGLHFMMSSERKSHRRQDFVNPVSREKEIPVKRIIWFSTVFNTFVLRDGSDVINKDALKFAYLLNRQRSLLILRTSCRERKEQHAWRRGSVNKRASRRSNAAPASRKLSAEICR